MMPDVERSSTYGKDLDHPSEAPHERGLGQALSLVVAALHEDVGANGLDQGLGEGTHAIHARKRGEHFQLVLKRRHGTTRTLEPSVACGGRE
jgi:hypothetical protein